MNPLNDSTSLGLSHSTTGLDVLRSFVDLETGEACQRSSHSRKLLCHGAGVRVLGPPPRPPKHVRAVLFVVWMPESPSTWDR